MLCFMQSLADEQFLSLHFKINNIAKLSTILWTQQFAAAEWSASIKLPAH